jgi:hypothetical protein
MITDGFSAQSELCQRHAWFTMVTTSNRQLYDTYSTNPYVTSNRKNITRYDQHTIFIEVLNYLINAINDVKLE